MRGELSFLQKILQLLLILMIATALSLTAFDFVPTNGVRSDVIVLFSQQPDGSYARDVTSNAIIIANAALRERADNAQQLNTSYQNIAESSSGGQAFTLSTYGADEARDLARENRTALNEILLEIRKHYGSTFPAFFDVVGNTYEAMRWQYVVAIGLISLLFSALVIKALSPLFLNKSEVVSDDEEEFEQWYKDKHVLEQINDLENNKVLPRDEIPSQVNHDAQDRPQQSHPQSTTADQDDRVESVVWTPINRNKQVEQNQEIVEEVTEDPTKNLQKRGGKNNNSQENDRSRLAEKWGKGSAAERLRALDEEKESAKVQESSKTQTSEMFSLSSLPRTKRKDSSSDNVNEIHEQGVRTQKQTSAGSPKTFSLPHQRKQSVAQLQEMDTELIEERNPKVSKQGSLNMQNDSPEESDGGKEEYFAPGGSLSKNPAKNESGNTTNEESPSAAHAPGNLPIVDVSAFQESSQTPSPEMPHEKQLVSTESNESLQQEDNDVDFYSEDADILIDSQKIAQGQEFTQKQDSQAIKKGEPTNQELKERLNKLLRGEL